MNEKATRYSFWLPDNLREQLKAIAEEEDRSVANVIIRMVKDGVRKHDGEKS